MQVLDLHWSLGVYDYAVFSVFNKTELISVQMLEGLFYRSLVTDLLLDIEALTATSPLDVTLST